MTITTSTALVTASVTVLGTVAVRPIIGGHDSALRTHVGAALGTQEAAPGAGALELGLAPDGAYVGADRPGFAPSPDLGDQAAMIARDAVVGQAGGHAGTYVANLVGGDLGRALGIGVGDAVRALGAGGGLGDAFGALALGLAKDYALGELEKSDLGRQLAFGYRAYETARGAYAWAQSCLVTPLVCASQVPVQVASINDLVRRGALAFPDPPEADPGFHFAEGYAFEEYSLRNLSPEMRALLGIDQELDGDLVGLPSPGSIPVGKDGGFAYAMEAGSGSDRPALLTTNERATSIALPGTHYKFGLKINLGDMVDGQRMVYVTVEAGLSAKVGKGDISDVLNYNPSAPFPADRPIPIGAKITAGVKNQLATAEFAIDPVALVQLHNTGSMEKFITLSATYSVAGIGNVKVQLAMNVEKGRVVWKPKVTVGRSGNGIESPDVYLKGSMTFGFKADDGLAHLLLTPIPFVTKNPIQIPGYDPNHPPQVPGGGDRPQLPGGD